MNAARAMRVGDVLTLKSGAYTVTGFGRVSTDSKFFGRYTVQLVASDGTNWIVGGKSGKVAWNARVIRVTK